METIRSTSPATVVFTGGGTAGHLFPGLAVAERLASEAPHLEVVFAGCGKHQEERFVRNAGFDYVAIASCAAPRRLREVAGFLKTQWSGYQAAGRLLRQRHAVCVVGLGGYASVPTARAALRQRIPLVLLEQNAKAGRANLWLARSATIFCSAFAEVKQDLPAGCHWRVTGNPVREGLVRRGWPDDSAAGAVRRQLLVLGGSRGARWLNAHVPLALARLRGPLSRWRIVHQSGIDDQQSTAALYRRLQIEATVCPFLVEMPAVLAESNVAVCRAGGTTLAELAVAGIPAVLIPYPHATDDHQRKNAEAFARTGGCQLLDQREAGAAPDHRLAESLLPLIVSRVTRESMGRAMQRMAIPDAAWDVATMIRRLVAATKRLSPRPIAA